MFPTAEKMESTERLEKPRRNASGLGEPYFSARSEFHFAPQEVARAEAQEAKAEAVEARHQIAALIARFEAQDESHKAQLAALNSRFEAQEARLVKVCC